MTLNLRLDLHVLLLVAAHLAGCVAASRDIPAATVPLERYRALPCEEIGQEARRIAKAARAISGVETIGAPPPNAADADAITWPILFFANGNGNGVNVDEFASLRGQFQGMKTVAAEKACQLQFVGP